LYHVKNNKIPRLQKSLFLKFAFIFRCNGCKTEFIF